MIHLRLVVAGDAAAVVERLEADPTVINIVHLPGAARRPYGDLVLCDVPRETASDVVRTLRLAGLDHEGSITIEVVDTMVSDRARAAERRAPGAPWDAVVWESVRARAVESAEPSGVFAAFMMLAALIAAIGIMTDSIILIIGAMVVGPEFGPMAGFCLATLERRWRLARQCLLSLSVGFVLAMTTAFLGTLASRGLGIAPEAQPLAERVATIFISRPDEFSVLVAGLAGVAGILSLTTNKGGTLVGVFISVTTIPAAADVGVSAAYGDADAWRGSLLQLGVNVGAIVAAGLLTLRVQQYFYAHHNHEGPDHGRKR